MWMYDVTGGWRIGKRHRRLGADEAPRPPADNATRATWRSATSTTTPRSTTPGSCSPSPAPPQHMVPLWPTAAGSRRSITTSTGASIGAGVDTGDGEISVAATVVVNAAGVWADEIRTLEDGAAARHDPPRQGHPRHAALGAVRQRHRRRDPGSRRQAQPLRRAVGTPTGRHVHPHLCRHDGHRLRRTPRRSAVHADYIGYVLGAVNAATGSQITAADVTGTGPGCGRSSGRSAAPARQISRAVTA